jgi:exonuclease VII large subunit
LVIGPEGSLIRSIAQINPGDRLTARLADGAFTSQVVAATPLDTGTSR